MPIGIDNCVTLIVTRTSVGTMLHHFLLQFDDAILLRFDHLEHGREEEGGEEPGVHGHDQDERPDLDVGQDARWQEAETCFSLTRDHEVYYLQENLRLPIAQNF